MGLCCAGAPVVLAFVSGIGLGFVINDFILFPLLFAALAFTFYAMWGNRKHHVRTTPLILAAIATVAVGDIATTAIEHAGFKINQV